MMNAGPGDEIASTRLAWWAAVGGLASALLTAFLNRTLVLDEEASGATTLGAIGFVVVVAAPFVLVLLASFLRDAEQRRSVWLASAALALAIAGLSIFSVGALFLIVAGALGWAWWSGRSPDGVIQGRISLAATLWIVLSLGGALRLLWWRETPACWLTGADGARWSAGQSATAATCVSDIFDATEGALALAAVAGGIAGAAVIRWLWNRHASPSALAAA
jgi:hypothetical protein